MNASYKIAYALIAAEFFLLFLIVASTYILKSYYILQKKIAAKIRTQVKIEQYLKKASKTPLTSDFSDFPKECRKLSELLPVIQEFDTTEALSSWAKIRPSFIRSIVLPLARQMALSANWVDRLYAAKAFGLLKSKEDEVLVNKLINDKIPIVFFHAYKAAILNDYELGLNSMLTRMSSESWTAQSIYLQPFDLISNKSYHFFEKKLLTERDITLRTTCYRILQGHIIGPVNWDISKDLNSSNMELKLAALKFYSYADPDAAVPFLIQALQDGEFTIRLIALHRLHILKAKQAIYQIIPLLDDPNWWIKMSAIEALKNMGKEGEDALKAHKPALDQLSFNLIHLVNTWW